jgi:hypothetical protein
LGGRWPSAAGASLSGRRPPYLSLPESSPAESSGAAGKAILPLPHACVTRDHPTPVRWSGAFRQSRFSGSGDCFAWSGFVDRRPLGLCARESGSGVARRAWTPFPGTLADQGHEYASNANPRHVHDGREVQAVSDFKVSRRLKPVFVTYNFLRVLPRGTPPPPPLARYPAGPPP